MVTLRALNIPTPGQDLATWLRATWQAYSAAELEAIFSRRQLRAGLEAGHVTRLAPNVYAGSTHAASFQTRVDAAILWAGPSSAVGGLAALYLHGVLDQEPPRIEVVVWHERRMRARPGWVRVRRVTYDAPVQHVGRWSVVPTEIAICQGFGECAPDVGVSVVARSMATGRASSTAIVEAVDTLPRVKGRRALLRTVAQCAAGAESYLEWHAAQRVFVGKPFDRLVRQHRVVAHGREYRLDMYDQETRVAVETDGASFHSGTDLWQRDLRRDADLASLGIQTVRFSYRDLHDRPQWCRERLLAILASRSPAA
ncbi:type IV toxin-antitoxin system AbiEi family antitoxin [Demequina aurantiaca]|uniref:type IV toxin-antitoxin system AbiEi family antitoxin n=1 Tax=Demequina aurantiaca TaxID=676200 RepID=UPI000A06C8C1|nr:DUF559 domain-containing protein [Demequina aurantiaca]